MNTMGVHAEFVLKEYLKQNGLTDEEIKKVTLVVLPPVSTRASNTTKTNRCSCFDWDVRGSCCEKWRDQKAF